MKTRIFNKFMNEISKTKKDRALLNLYNFCQEYAAEALQQILDDNELLASIAEKSTIHSNNFSKIVLASENGWKLRLHIWEDVDYVQEHEPHNHRWDFYSYILCGNIINEIVEEVNDNGTFLKCAAHETKIGQTRVYDKIGIKSLKVVSEDEIEKDECYRMKSDVIHIAKIQKNTFTATLFLTSPAKEDVSIVYMPDLKEPPSDKVLNPFTVQMLKNKIGNVLANL